MFKSVLNNAINNDSSDSDNEDVGANVWKIASSSSSKSSYNRPIYDIKAFGGTTLPTPSMFSDLGKVATASGVPVINNGKYIDYKASGWGEKHFAWAVLSSLFLQLLKIEKEKSKNSLHP